MLTRNKVKLLHVETLDHAIISEREGRARPALGELANQEEVVARDLCCVIANNDDVVVDANNNNDEDQLEVSEGVRSKKSRHRLLVDGKRASITNNREKWRQQSVN